MKKVLLLVVTIIMTIGLFTVSIAAAPAVTERPDIQIIIDGVKSTYTNTPIIVNGRTLLPLRELLTNLGVANDDQHIIWDGKDNSVTAIKDSTKLYLKVGATSAKINEQETTIDAAPVNYKGRVYIPAKFAAEAFDKVVVWDKQAKRVYMRNTADFNEVKTTLEKSVALMDGLQYYKESVDDNWFVTTAGEKSDFSFSSIGQIDKTKKIAYYKDTYTMGAIGENYYINQLKYSSLTTDEEWEEEDTTYFSDHYLDLNDVLFAALSVDKNQSGNIIHLIGNVSLLYNSDDDPTFKVDFEKSSTEIYIDKTTGYITKCYMNDTAQVTPKDDAPYLLEDEISVTVSDFNKKITINLPSELQ